MLRGAVVGVETSPSQGAQQRDKNRLHSTCFCGFAFVPGTDPWKGVPLISSKLVVTRAHVLYPPVGESPPMEVVARTSFLFQAEGTLTTRNSASRWGKVAPLELNARGVNSAYEEDLVTANSSVDSSFGI